MSVGPGERGDASEATASSASSAAGSVGEQGGAGSASRQTAFELTGPARTDSASASFERGRDYVVARLVSIVLHPFAVFLLLTLLGISKSAPQALAHALIGVGAAIAATWLFVLQRKHSGRWGTVDASDRRERPLLYLVLLAVLALCWWWMRGLSGALSTGIVAVAAMLLVAAALNVWIKLSLHMASLAFAAVSLSALSWPWACAATVLLPVLGWARLRMARHSAAEVVGGTVLGALAGFALRAVAG
ncbi:hypothetical protein [Pseudomonas sp. CGJS7]|uniref:hypothetical protein n=1 Tax=Pseudomonas sp. CGJS7 TaxID=3109348 RepID=UPI003009EB8F